MTQRYRQLGGWRKSTARWRGTCDSSFAWWPLAFYNSGKHLYSTTGEPRFLHAEEMTFLRFAEYCHGGNCNGVGFRHLGHLFGINGGRAKVEVCISGRQFALDLLPKKVYWIFENGEQVKIFVDIGCRSITGIK